MATKKAPLDPVSAVPAEDKKKALETAISQIEKSYGKGSIMRLGDNLAVNVESIPTGSLSLDLALGIGGVPKGRIIEIYGPESSGKTTLALHIIASAQKKGGEVAFIDAEHAWSRPMPGAGREHRGAAHCPAGHRRGCPCHHGDAGPFRRCGRGGGGLRGRPGAPQRDRGRDGRQQRGRGGAPHVPGAAEAGRLHLQDELHRGVYQPAP